MGSDFYTPGQDLSRRAILQILLEEVYRDGTASDEERKTVQYLRKALKLEDDAYKAVKARVKELYKAGRLAGPGEMDPVRVYRRAIELAYADGKVSGKERVYLKVLGKVLWITPEEHARVVREIKQAAATPPEEALPIPDTTEIGLKDPDMPAEPPPARTSARPLASLPKPPPLAPTPPPRLEPSDGDSSDGGASGTKPTPAGAQGERVRPVATGPIPAGIAAGAEFPASMANLGDGAQPSGSEPVPAPAARPRERERTRPVSPRAAAPPPEPAPAPPDEPAQKPPPPAPPPEPEPAPSATQPRASRPTGTYSPQRATGAHGAVTGGSRPVKTPPPAGKPEQAISKPVLYGGLGALGLVLVLFVLQRTLMGPPAEDEPEPEPARPAVEEPVNRPAPPPPAKPPAVNLQADKHLASGLQALQAGKLDEAIADYKKAVALEDKQAFVHNNLGHAYERKGDDDSAMKEYQRAIELDPKYPLAYNNLGTIYERKGRTMEAMALYRKSVEIKPDYGNAHYNLGVMYGRAGRYDEAIVHFKKVVELRPGDAYAHKDLWLAYSRKGLDAEARKELEEARKLGLKIGE